MSAEKLFNTIVLIFKLNFSMTWLSYIVGIRINFTKFILIPSLVNKV